MEAVQGMRVVYLYRILSDAKTKAASAVAFATENKNKISRDADSTKTKDGSIRTPGGIEVEISFTSIMAKGDTLYDSVKKAVKEGSIVEVWEVNLDEKGTDTNADKYKATYYQGYITEVELSSPSDDFAELSITYGANGSGADGYATLSKEQQEIAEYAFKDTSAYA